jgi:hypothetical protein
VLARRLIAVVALGAALALPAVACADGDPASDVLLLRDFYLPYAPQPSKPLAASLKTLLVKARRSGYPMKVALIQSRGDLGAYPELFDKAPRYAKLLTREIAFKVKHPHLLVVMAAGGLAGTNLGPGAAVLPTIKIDRAKQSDGLVEAAIDAVETIAAAHGHEIAAEPPKKTRASGGSSHTGIYIGAAIAVLAGLGLIVMSLRGRRRG